MFENVFKMTSHISDGSSIELDISVGVYNQGLLQILGQRMSAKVWQCWSKRYGGDFIPFASTGFGELFLWNVNKKWVEHFCPQTEHFEFIDRDVGWILNEFLVLDEILESVLKVEMFQQLISKHSQVPYGNCFILQPWIKLGGQEDVMNFSQGDLAVYHALVAQS